MKKVGHIISKYKEDAYLGIEMEILLESETTVRGKTCEIGYDHLIELNSISKNIPRI